MLNILPVDNIGSIMDPPKGLAFLHDGVIYYFPNCSCHVVVPAQTDPGQYQFMRRNAQLDCFQQPQWWTVPYGFLAFVPLLPKFSEAAFECLCDIMPHSICPSEKHIGKFVLSPEKAAQWHNLEDLLILICALLKNQSYFLLGPSLAPAAPSSLGYRLPFYTPCAACLQMIKAQDWFAVWMAQILFLLAYFENNNMSADVPAWFSFLESKGIAHSWLSGLQSSTVCDFLRYCPVWVCSLISLRIKRTINPHWRDLNLYTCSLPQNLYKLLPQSWSELPLQFCLQLFYCIHHIYNLSLTNHSWHTLFPIMNSHMRGPMTTPQHLITWLLRTLTLWQNHGPNFLKFMKSKTRKKWQARCK